MGLEGNQINPASPILQLHSAGCRGREGKITALPLVILTKEFDEERGIDLWMICITDSFFFLIPLPSFCADKKPKRFGFDGTYGENLFN